MEEELKEYIRKKRKEYMVVKNVLCPAFSNEKIYFTDKGFTHLIRKDKHLRPSDEQIRRLTLLPHAKDILVSSYKFSRYRKVESRSRDTHTTNSTLHFWSFVKKIDGKNVIVVVRQINNEPKHFFSIMDKT